MECPRCGQSFLVHVEVPTAATQQQPIFGVPPPTWGRVVQAGECARATVALNYALVGLLCLGIIFGPLAIMSGLEAKRIIAANPQMTGGGKATTAIVLGLVEIALFIFFVLWRLKSGSFLPQTPGLMPNDTLQ